MASVSLFIGLLVCWRVYVWREAIERSVIDGVCEVCVREVFVDMEDVC